jgi:hypothetical protein
MKIEEMTILKEAHCNIQGFDRKLAQITTFFHT